MADLSGPVCTGALIAKATGLSYTPVNDVGHGCKPGKCLLMFLPTGIAWDVT